MFALSSEAAAVTASPATDMEPLVLLGFLVLLVLVAAAIRGRAVAAEEERRRADQAETDLQTTRRIQDATDTPLPPDDARGWLRDFGDGGPSGER